MKPITFRNATPADSARIAALHAESWRSAYRGILPDAYLDEAADLERAELWRRRFAAPPPQSPWVLLAEAGPELVGFVCVLLDEEPIWGACLDNLHVHPRFRGRRLGRRLFAEAARWVMQVRPGWPMHLWVFAANRPACRFYEACRGEVAACEAKPMPGGVQVDSVRYVWRDLHALLGDSGRLPEPRG